jgi:hypothetical protein
MGIRISQVPTEYREQLVKNLVEQRGPIGAVMCVEEDTLLAMAFGWDTSPEGQQFWDDVDKQRSSSCSSKSCSIFVRNNLDVYTEEAERRGFAIGVMTKYGEIVQGYGNELLANGDFFYSNIKVFEQGKWLKPLHEVTETKASNEMPEMADIHTLFSYLISTIRRN